MTWSPILVPDHASSLCKRQFENQRQFTNFLWSKPSIRIGSNLSVFGELRRPNGPVAYESETLKILKIDSGGIFNKIDDATSNIIRLLSNRCVLESLTVRSRMKPDFGEQILKLSKNTKLVLVDLTQIVVVKIIQDRYLFFHFF